MDSKLIEVYAVEEIDIDRSYNKKGKKRQTHLEIIGGGYPMLYAVGIAQKYLR